MIQDSAQAVDTVGHMIAADPAVVDTLTAALVGPIMQALADSSAQEIAREAFVGDPVRQGAAILAVVVVLGLGLFCAVWILGRKYERDQASLTQLGVIAFSIAISQWVWQMLAATFLGIGDFETVNSFGQWIIGFALLGAGAVKAGSTVLAREQIRHGQQVTGGKD